MKPEFVLKCTSADALLRFTSRGPDSWNISLSGRGFSGNVDAYDDHWETLPQFFKDVSDSWKGWDGEKSWQSLEGDVLLSASANRTGSVLLKVKLRQSDGEADWEVKGAIHLEAGQLDSLYSLAIKAFQKLNAE